MKDNLQNGKEFSQQFIYLTNEYYSEHQGTVTIQQQLDIAQQAVQTAREPVRRCLPLSRC